MVQFERMTEEEFILFLNEETTYQCDYSKAKNIPLEQARREIKAQKLQILPNGFKTLNHYFYNIIDRKQDLLIGRLWFLKVPKSIIKRTDGEDLNVFFLGDILIFPKHRKKGFGKQALVVLEQELIKLQATTVALHVFKHNQRAFNLYKKSGYQIQEESETGYQMSKRINKIG